MSRRQFAPQRIDRRGTWLVNRDWIIDYTRAGRTTVARWYQLRAQAPGELRHPERVARIERQDWWEQEAFTSWYAAFLAARRTALASVDVRALYAGAASDVVSIHDAAQWLGYSSAAVIRVYRSVRPGYFPEPVTRVPGCHGRSVPAFRRGALWEFDRRRGGQPPPVGELGPPGGGEPCDGTRSAELTDRQFHAPAWGESRWESGADLQP